MVDVWVDEALPPEFADAPIVNGPAQVMERFRMCPPSRAERDADREAKARVERLKEKYQDIADARRMRGEQLQDPLTFAREQAYVTFAEQDAVAGSKPSLFLRACTALGGGRDCRARPG